MAYRRDMPEDMKIEIMLMLPVKSLLRFRCLSKSWCSLFQTPYFKTQHYLKRTSLSDTNNNHANPSVFLCRPRYYHYVHLSMLDHTLTRKQDIRLSFPIIDLCYGNGLICFWNYNMMTLWNPATREFKLLQPPCIPNLKPKKFNRITQIGFNSKTNDYKVLCIWISFHDKRFSVTQQSSLYSLNADSWKETRFDFSVRRSNRTFNIVNCVHYCASRTDNCIVAFDMADEVFWKLSMPPFELSSNYGCDFVGVLNGNLAVVSSAYVEWINRKGTKISVDIWVMKEYGVQESWTKQFTIGPISSHYSSMGLWKKGGLFLCNPLITLYVYDPDTQKIEKLQVDSLPLIEKIFNYTESLVSLHGRQEREDERFVRLPTQSGDT
ncbi:F-box domain-containing protein [Cephalotus follicularis]|uniref:F-box domain-containing protein n=1 Tax=Cephalotus follicularis TaxID=3775 RepID=A0A1Q3CM95_CEPFO|nr:F-box domain-containing protein [Cephalotus follicularis]